MLHAAAIAFPHPSGGERRVEAPVPTDMVALVRALDLAVPARWTADIS
jgi:tRNA pseudouridine32 synthase/23S rRNA pseudouridine746 synthase